MSRPTVEGSFIKSARLYGRRGDRQHGIDVIAETDDGSVANWRAISDSKGDRRCELVARYLDPAAKPPKIAEIVDALAQSQIIDDDGRKIRIVPDVLSDDIVARAAFDLQGRSTGFVKKLSGFLVKDAGTKRRFVDLYLDHLLWTFGYAEWRRPSELKRRKSIAEPLARWTIDALDDPAINSSELLAPWSKAAALLPEATLDIVDALLSKHPKDVATEFLSPIRHVPSLLESVATGRRADLRRATDPGRARDVSGARPRSHRPTSRRYRRADR